TALEDRSRKPQVVVGTPSLRWSIDIAAGAGPIGRRWGDWHFARSLAAALERLGQWVEIDHPQTRTRSTRSETDVVLTLRGLERVAPAPGATTLLWVISHPDTVTGDEIAEHDAAFAASTTWAARHGATPLLQCTDATRFHPGVGSPGSTSSPGSAGSPGSPGSAGSWGSGPDVLFVGNARGGMRPVVAAARAADVATSVIGTGWAELGIEAAADRIANTDLPSAYASAGVVLNDHHADMAAEGFVSTRVFDVLAVGGRLLSDPVVGLDQLLETLGTTLPTWETPHDLARLARPPYDAWPDVAARLALAERVVAEHSFDARAATLLDAALRVRGERRA
ncbi:glycosyltransferase, partial [Nocardioides sp.]|uniref:glycosyltransferase n=1 Tax=Nocardioides sp. TaxID=35761 RepID=UPI002B278724